MAAKMKLTIDKAGVRAAALTSPEVRAAVHAAAAEIAARAEVPAHETQDYGVEVIDGGKSRARSYVVLRGPNSVALESRHRILGRALGGA